MTINKLQENGKLTLAIEGKLDTNTAPQLNDALIPAFDEVKQVELDFSQLSYISSAGLRVLLTGEKTAQSKGASMTLLGVPEEIFKIFKMTGFDDMLTIV